MAWFDDLYHYRLEIELTNIYNTNDLIDYIALVAFNDIPANWRAHFFQNVEFGYGDILFTTANGTHVPHVLDRNTGSDYAWVKIPTLTAGVPTVVYLYYGSTGQIHPSEADLVYSDYSAVYHLNNATTTIDDATANNNDGTEVGSLLQDTMVIGEGLAFDDTDYITVPHDPSLDITGDIWIQFWIDISTTGRVFDLVQKGNAFRVYMGGGGKVNFVTGANTLTTGGSLSTGSTTKVTCLRKNGVKYIYLDDTLDVSVAYATALSTNTDPLLISSSANPLDGSLDELQYGSFAPANEAQHVAVEYQNELNHETFTTYNAFEVIPITGDGGLRTSGEVSKIIGNDIYVGINFTAMLTSGAAEVSFEKKYIWVYRVPITINAAQIPDGADLLNYPMLFDLDLPDDVQQHIGDYAYGDDFVFTNSDEQTKIPHEIEGYDPVTGRMRAWVKIPVLPTTVDKTIWMYYRHNNIFETQELESTWSDYWAVYHLSASPVTDAPQALDSTINGSSMTSSGFVPGDHQAGIVDYGYYFDGIDNKLTTDISRTYGGWDQITVEAWHYELVNNTNVETLFAQSFDLNPSNGGAWFIGSKADNYRVQFRTETNNIRYEATSVITLNAWNYFAFTWNAADDLLTLYKDGAIVGTPQTVVGNTLYDDISVKTTVGATANNSGYLNGRADELRISKKEQPDHYFQTVDNNLRSPQTFVAVGQPEAHWRAIGGMTLSYESSALNDRTIVFEYPGPIDTVHGPSGGITTTGVALIDKELSYSAFGGMTLSYESSALNDRTIVFEYTASGSGLHFGGSDYYIVFARDGSGSAYLTGAPDYYPVFYYESTGSAYLTGAPDYYPVFYWVSYGGGLHAGSTVIDFIIIIFAPAFGQLTFLPVEDINPNFIEIIFTDHPSGSIHMDQPNVVVFCDYEPHYIYTPKLPTAPNLRFKGGASWQIQQSQFYYQATGKARFRGNPVYSFFANKVYVGSGLLKFKLTHQLTKYYLYTASYIYTNVSGGAVLTPLSLPRSLTLYADDPSGLIEFKGDGDVTADQVYWKYKYVASGGLRSKITSAPVEYSINLHYDVKTATIIWSGGIEIIFQSSIYEYIPSGGIEIVSARFFSWEGAGQLVFSGTVGTVGAGTTLEKVYVYTGSGGISLDAPGVTAQADYDPVYSHIVTGKIKLSGTVDPYIGFIDYQTTGSIIITGDANYTSVLDYIADSTGGELDITITSVRYVEYIYAPAGGKAILSGDAIEVVEYTYVASGFLRVAGQSNLVYQEYAASGNMILSYAPGVIGTVTTDYRYIGSGKIKFVAINAYRINDYNYIVKTQRIRLRGSSAEQLANIIYPDYATSGSIVTYGDTSYSYTNLYSYTATSSLLLSGIATTSSTAAYSYNASGSTSFDGTAEYSPDALSYLYAAAGSVFFNGDSGTIGQDFYEYTAIGSLNSFGVTQVNYRFVIQRLTNVTNAPRSLRESLAQKLFTFYTNK